MINKIKELNYKRKIKRNYNKKITQFSFKRDLVFEEECVRYFAGLGIDINLKKYFSLYYYFTKNRDIHYIPEDIFYKSILTTLNDRRLNLAYSDKGAYHRLVAPDFLIPNLAIFSNGAFIHKESDEKIRTVLKKQGLIFKPSVGSSKGIGISFANNFSEYENLLVLYQQSYLNFVIQEVVSQHEFTAQFNKTSLNTIRCFVYKSPYTGKAHVLNSAFKVGKQNSRVDNHASGGTVIGIKQGILGKFSIDKHGKKSDSINSIDLKNNEYSFPCWNKIIEVAENSTANFNHATFLGLDICLLKDNIIKVVEFNLQKIDINIHQITNGPIFGKYTEEILTLVKQRNKKVKF